MIFDFPLHPMSRIVYVAEWAQTYSNLRARWVYLWSSAELAPVRDAVWRALETMPRAIVSQTVYRESFVAALESRSFSRWIYLSEVYVAVGYFVDEVGHWMGCYCSSFE